MEDESFDPTLEREDKDDFKVKVPTTIERYIDKHFRRSLSKEERTAMLKRHPKLDIEVVSHLSWTVSWQILRARN